MVLPPTEACFSMMITLAPSWLACTPAAQPAPPAPMTSTRSRWSRPLRSTSAVPMAFRASTSAPAASSARAAASGYFTGVGGAGRDVHPKPLGSHDGFGDFHKEPVADAGVSLCSSTVTAAMAPPSTTTSTTRSALLPLAAPWNAPSSIAVAGRPVRPASGQGPGKVPVSS